MDKELRKIYKNNKQETIVDIEIPRKKSERAIVRVKIDDNFNFTGSADEIIGTLNEYKTNYNNIDIQGETEDDYYVSNYTVYKVYGSRLETDDEYNKRQVYHQEQKEKTRIDKEIQKEKDKIDAENKERQEKEEYERLKAKYE